MLKNRELNEKRESLRAQIREITRRIDAESREETAEERSALDRLGDEEMEIMQQYKEWRRSQKQRQATPAAGLSGRLWQRKDR